MIFFYEMLMAIESRIRYPVLAVGTCIFWPTIFKYTACCSFLLIHPETNVPNTCSCLNTYKNNIEIININKCSSQLLGMIPNDYFNYYIAFYCCLFWMQCCQKEQTFMIMKTSSNLIWSKMSFTRHFLV